VCGLVAGLKVQQHHCWIQSNSEHALSATFSTEAC